MCACYASTSLLKFRRKKHLPRLRLSEEALKVMENYPWPGNVRELENTIQRASVLATSDVLLPKDIPLGWWAATRWQRTTFPSPDDDSAGLPAGSSNGTPENRPL